MAAKKTAQRCDTHRHPRIITDIFTIQVHFWPDNEPVAWRIWKLVLVEIDGVFTSSIVGSGSLPPYDEATTGQSSTRVQRVGSEHDEFGTVVNEVTVVTTVTNSTITTRKRYRVEDA
jgi:hypothetical protein